MADWEPETEEEWRQHNERSSWPERMLGLVLLWCLVVVSIALMWWMAP